MERRPGASAVWASRSLRQSCSRLTNSDCGEIAMLRQQLSVESESGGAGMISAVQANRKLLPAEVGFEEVEPHCIENSETLSQASLLRCSENTPRRSLTESRRVERNPASWIDRPPIAAKYACRRQSAERLQFSIRRFALERSSPSPRFQPKISVSLTIFEVLTQPPKTCSERLASAVQLRPGPPFFSMV